MTIVKKAGTGAFAIILTLFMFSIMQALVSNDGIFEKPSREASYLNFIRLNNQESELNTKDRRLPEPPLRPRKHLKRLNFPRRLSLFQRTSA